MDSKEFYEKTEEFAKKIVSLAADDGFTVHEFCKVVDMAKAIAECSTVDKESIEKCDYLSQHITTTLDGKKIFESVGRIGTPMFNC